MTRDEERRRTRNAKRLLWLLVVAVVLLAGVMAYTSLNAPDPASRTSEGAMPPVAPSSSEQQHLRPRIDAKNR